jgi:hypothetical protein
VVGLSVVHELPASSATTAAASVQRFTRDSFMRGRLRAVTMRDSLSPIKCLEVAVSDVPGKCRDDFATEREAMHSGHSRGRRPLDITQQTWLPRLDTGPIFGKPTPSCPSAQLGTGRSLRAGKQALGRRPPLKAQR